MAGKVLNLRWSLHASNIQTIFTDLLNNECFADVTLSCEGKFVKAHRMVLSACSTYFQTMFKFHQIQHPVIIFSGIQFQDLKHILEFMYKGEVKIQENELDGVLSAAEVLRVKGLSKIRGKTDENVIKKAQGTVVQSTTTNSTEIRQTKNEQLVKLLSPPYSSVNDSSSTANVPCGSTVGNPLVTRTVLDNGKPLKSILNSNCGKSSSPSGTKPQAQLNVSPLIVYMNKVPFKKTVDVSKAATSSSELTKLKGQSFRILSNKSELSSNSEGEYDDPTIPTKLVIDMKEGKPCNLEDSSPVIRGRSTCSRSPRLGSSKKRHSERLRSNKIPRPQNAFMIFANLWRKRIADEFPQDNNKAISVRLGKMWKDLSDGEKVLFYTHARSANEAHKQKFPGYYYSPSEARLRKKMQKEKQTTSAKKRKMELVDTPFKFVKVNMGATDFENATSDSDTGNNSKSPTKEKISKVSNFKQKNVDREDSDEDINYTKSVEEDPFKDEGQTEPFEMVLLDQVKIEKSDYDSDAEGT